MLGSNMHDSKASFIGFICLRTLIDKRFQENHRSAPRSKMQRRVRHIILGVWIGILFQEYFHSSDSVESSLLMLISSRCACMYEIIFTRDDVTYRDVQGRLSSEILGVDVASFLYDKRHPKDTPRCLPDPPQTAQKAFPKHLAQWPFSEKSKK